MKRILTFLFCLALLSAKAGVPYIVNLGGLGTNATFSDRSVSGTNAFYVRGWLRGGDHNVTANYFYASTRSTGTIYTNSPGYAVNYENPFNANTSCNPFPITIYAGTNGDVCNGDWQVIGGTFNTNTWLDEVGNPLNDGTFGNFGQYYPALIAGRIEGNGAGLTNLNGATIQAATITSAALGSGALTNVSGDINTSGNLTATNHYGNASTLRGLPVGGTAIWKNLSLPMFIFTTFSVDHVVANGGPHAATVSNIVGLTSVKGVTAALLRHGLTPFMHLDVGWPYATRDANGLIQWNTNKFPTGIPALSTYLHANNWKMGGSLYYSDKDHPTSGGVFEPIMTASTIYQDINQYRNGLFFDWIRASDGNGNNTASYQNEFAIGLAYAVTYPNNLPAGNTNKAGLIIDYGSHDAMIANLGPYVNSRWSDQGVGSGNPGVRAMTQLRASEKGDGTTNGPTETSSQSGKGHFIGHNLLNDSWDGGGGLVNDDYRTPFACEAIKPAEVVFALTNWTATYLQAMTNDSWLSIMADPLGLPGSIIYDNGSSSTLLAARALTNGCFTVFLRNDGATSSNMVATFSQIHNPVDWAPMGSPVGQWAMNGGPYQVDHVFGLTNVSVASYGSVTFTVAAATSELLLMTPLTPPITAQTNFLSGIWYTNATGRAQTVQQTFSVIQAAVNGAAIVNFITGQQGAALGTWITNDWGGQQTLSTSLATTNGFHVGGFVSNSIVWCFTNQIVGAGNSITPRAGTGQLITY